MSDERSDLAQQQREVLEALLDGRPSKARIERGHLNRMIETLRLKRRREAAICAPRLHAELKEEFNGLFDAYAEKHGYPKRGGPLGDVVGFGRMLQRKGRLPRSAAQEAIILRCRWGFPMRWIRVRGGDEGGGIVLFVVRTGGRVHLFRWGKA